MKNPSVRISNNLRQRVGIIGRHLTWRGWEYELTASSPIKHDFTKYWYQLIWRTPKERTAKR